MFRKFLNKVNPTTPTFTRLWRVSSPVKGEEIFSLSSFPSLGGRGKGRGDFKISFNELVRLDTRHFLQK